VYKYNQLIVLTKESIMTLCDCCNRGGCTVVMRPSGVQVCNACWCYVCNTLRTIDRPFDPFCSTCDTLGTQRSLERQRLEAQRLEAQRLEAQRLEAQRLERQYEERHGRIMYAALCA
jgi:hypothetical protein